MIEIFPANANNSKNSFSTHKIVRFCALADHNIVLSVETHDDGSERKICQNINACKNKSQCRYLTRPVAAN